MRPQNQCNRSIQDLARLFLCCGILLITAAGFSSTGRAPAAVSPDMAASSSEMGSAAKKFLDGQSSKSVRDLVRRLREALEKSKNEIIANGVTSANQATLQAWLMDAEAEINTLLNPQQEPNLTPIDAGEILVIVTPMTVDGYATLLDDLAAWAGAEAELEDASHVLIGSYVKTIDFWLPDLLQAVLDS